MDGYGFGMIQGTRPQTLGYSLPDSPPGLAAWLGEKLVSFADTRPEASGGVSLAQQLDNIAPYWFTGTGASTARWYWEAMQWTPRSAEEENAQIVTVPTACTLFPAEAYPVARRWAESRFHNLISWNEMNRAVDTTQAGNSRSRRAPRSAPRHSSHPAGRRSSRRGCARRPHHDQ